MGRIEWRKGLVRWTGRIGSDVDAFVVQPHTWEHAEAGAWELDVLLPGFGGEKRVQYENEDNAKLRAEDILKEFLKKSGLQPKPVRPKVVPPAVRRVETYLARRAELSGAPRSTIDPQVINSVGPAEGDEPLYLTMADLQALVKLAKRAGA
jgi:hypothetical protein